MIERPKRAELLMPAGNLEKLKTAFVYGADAIYMGTPDMSLRAKSEVTLDDVVEGISFAHDRGKKVYLTLNLFSHNKDIAKLPEYVDTIRDLKPDGLLIADPGVFMFVKERAPELPLHVSTQANVCSWQSVKFWHDIGAKLVVLGREVSFAEFVEIREKCPDIRLEAFVHGAMCMTYSGRCLLSNFMAERGANQGSCANACRWKYKVHMKLKDGTVKELNLTEENLEMFDFFLEEGNRPGELMEIQEDDRGSYILNSRDLCLLPKLPELLGAGIDTLKVEGRGKSPYYVGIVARAYRMAIDAWYDDPDNWSAAPYMEELSTVPSRGYTYAFHDGRLTNHSHGYDHTGGVSDWEYAGHVLEVHDDAFIVQAKNKLSAGDVLEFVPPGDGDALLLRAYEFENADNGRMIEVIQPSGKFPRFRVPFSLFHEEDISTLAERFPKRTIIRKDRPLTQVQWDRIKIDREALAMEEGTGEQRLYDKSVGNLQASLDKQAAELKFRTPRVGKEGCCGRGCNGCLIFWHDPKYEKARAILSKKKQGELLKVALTG